MPTTMCDDNFEYQDSNLLHKAKTRNEQSFGLKHEKHLGNKQKMKMPILFRYLQGAFVLLFLSLTMLSCNNKSAEVSGEEEVAVASKNYVDAIEELSNNSRIQKAFQFIQENDDQTIKTLIELTELPAPPFKEDQFGRSARFAELLQEYGADSVWTDAVGNVIGLRKGTVRDSVLALAAHLDTVFPEGTDVTVTTRGDTLYAPGIGDDTRGLTAVLTVLRAFDANNIETRNDILFVGDVGEEGPGDLRGMKELFSANGPKIDTFISIDGSNSTGITNGALGSHRYKVTFKGPGGHSWGAFGLANPHHALGQAIADFVKSADNFTKTGPKTSYNVGIIGGGTSVNSIPFESWVVVDMRSISPASLNQIDTLFQKAMRSGLAAQNKLRRSGPPLTLDVEMVGNRPSGHTNSSQPLVQRAIAATSHFGNEPQLRTSSTDSNIPISKGIPAITLGGGGVGGNAHSLNEWYLNTDGYKGIQRVLLIVASQAGIELD